MYKIREYPNSLRLISKKMQGVSSASLGIWFNVGSRYEDVSLNGVSHFLEHVVFKGSQKYTGDAIKESIEGVGGSLNGFTSEENTCYYAKFLGKHLKKVLDVLADMTLRPLLKKEDIEKERTVIIEEIKMYKDLPQYQVQELFDSLLWPDHPLGRNIAGSAGSIAGIAPMQIGDFHRRWYTSGSTVVSCAGDLDAKAAEELVEERFGRLPRSGAGSFAPFNGGENPLRVKVLTKDIEQTHINLGFPSLRRSHKDRFALMLLHVILGGNMSSRLFNEIREKKGLAYEIGTHAKKLHDTGVFFVHAGIDNKNLLETSRLIFKELDRIRREKVASGELRRAKEFAIGQSEMSLDDPLEHMLWIGESLANLGYIQTKEEVHKLISKVTSADVLRVAQDTIDWKKLVFAAVGPQKGEVGEEIKDVVTGLS